MKRGLRCAKCNKASDLFLVNEEAEIVCKGCTDWYDNREGGPPMVLSDGHEGITKVKKNGN